MSSRPPSATCRLQFNRSFTFHDAVGSLDYLHRLGVSHVYASPYLQAARGSEHGYDVVDPGRVNSELGGEEGHGEFCRALEELGMGQILDIVPNHMAIEADQNRWWWDVLENGPSSAYAIYFDVDWEPPEARLANTILLPILEDHYGRVLERGLIRLVREQGRFLVRYRDHALPLAPRSLEPLLARAALRTGLEELGFLADALGGLPHPSAVDLESARRRHRGKEVLLRWLLRLLEQDEGAAEATDLVLGATNADPDLLDHILGSQNYRLAYWKAAGRDIGYRRFFNIASLAALRIEEPQVFDDTHRRVLEWVSGGLLDGLRIDHVDGLRDPALYLERLRQAAPGAWLVVEKILHPGEQLPEGWPVAGTTGYDFNQELTQLLIDGRSEQLLTSFYKALTGGDGDWPELVREKKRLLLRDSLASDLNRLVELTLTVCERHRRYRDYDRQDIGEALRELLAWLPVYRTYTRPDEGEVREEDREVVSGAVAGARGERPDLDPELFGFLEGLLLLRWRGEAEDELVYRFQQLSGPAMAKGVEDTAFYSYNRFIALNEVGGDPSMFGAGLQEFHEAMERRFSLHPHGMLCTSTHDTKRSEDVRARLLVISEIPEEWTKAVTAWSAHNDRYRRSEAPDRNEEYLLYQTLVGAWPLPPERAREFMVKAMREAGVNTSWGRVNQDWEGAVLSFVEDALGDHWFREELDSFVDRILLPGRHNSLSMVLLKLTAPGIPDIYQGCDLWDLSLVDPDNRRPVCWETRRHALSLLCELQTPEEILSHMDMGIPKLHVLREGLALRRRRPEAYGAEAVYRPLVARGPAADGVVAFMRGQDVAVVVPRHTAANDGRLGGTAVVLPGGRWRNVLTGDVHEGGDVSISELLSRFPVALLERAEP